ncbi:hypothetical protein BDP81DRAFT_416240 [Colletotrichum phormii]|uniref:Secreted protein n=1 Tax=Colletotrichum phormii TaxID=359342 RepID=A0AAJ0A1C1_9PEZI|nr:uncharacterized protein BDP81DRAFT_416240 [Colletotrichum phormii]KAK1654657.1 hypothetical protein BDP81DRAFT_416240 [Colletotrichum phormii]
MSIVLVCCTAAGWLAMASDSNRDHPTRLLGSIMKEPDRGTGLATVHGIGFPGWHTTGTGTTCWPGDETDASIASPSQPVRPLSVTCAVVH